MAGARMATFQMEVQMFLSQGQLHPSRIKIALPLPFSPYSLRSNFPASSQMKAPSQMINMPSHIHPLPAGDSSLSRAMLVTAAKTSLLMSIQLLWMTLISLRRFWSLGSAPVTRRILGPLTQASPLPCLMGGHSLDRYSVPRPGSATALLRACHLPGGSAWPLWV